jgi:heme-degrading monooxygenase HmoA
MYIILWEYIVKPGHEAAFERIYGSHGDWTQFFKRVDGYLGTDLLRDTENSRRYITIDRWISSTAFASSQKQYRVEYEAIDARSEYLTEQQTRIGAGDLFSLPSQKNYIA